MYDSYSTVEYLLNKGFQAREHSVWTHAQDTEAGSLSASVSAGKTLIDSRGPQKWKKTNIKKKES